MHADGNFSPRRHVVMKVLGVITSLLAFHIWLATVVTLFAEWAGDDFVRYEADDGEVEYFSTVGAAHKPGFILGTATTGIFYVLTLILTKLCFDLETPRQFKRDVSIISIGFGFISGMSLLLLGIFDSISYKVAHYTFTGIFIVFTLLSAILTVVHRSIRNQYNRTVGLRAVFIGLVIPLVITFAMMDPIGERDEKRSNLKSVAASLEWSIAILFCFYLSLLTLDLLFDG